MLHKLSYLKKQDALYNGKAALKKLRSSEKQINYAVPSAELLGLTTQEPEEGDLGEEERDLGEEEGVGGEGGLC